MKLPPNKRNNWKKVVTQKCCEKCRKSVAKDTAKIKEKENKERKRDSEKKCNIAHAVIDYAMTDDSEKRRR